MNEYISFYDKNKYRLEVQEILRELKKLGASQKDCVLLLKSKLDLTLKEADKFVIDSMIWKEDSEITKKFREEINDSIDDMDFDEIINEL